MRPKSPPPAASDRGTAVAMVFALVAERLNGFYEHGQWLNEAQAATLAADWLARSGREMPLAQRRHLAAVSNEMARQMAASLSREAGLYTAHEMMASLDPSYHSELAMMLLQTCENQLDGSAAVNG